MKCLSCGKSCRTPKADNWILWQNCYQCALKNHPEYYEHKPKHGTGGTWMGEIKCIPMTTEVIKIKTL